MKLRHGNYMTERTMNMGGEMHREEIETREGVYLGAVVYVRRKLAKGGSQYGWRPEKSPRVRLTTKGEAIERLVVS